MELSNYINSLDKWYKSVFDLVLLTLVGLLLHKLGYLIYSYPFTPIYIKQSPQPIVVIVFLVYLITLFLLLRIGLKNILIRVFHLKEKFYVFNSQDWPNKWIFNGGTHLKGSSELIIKSSRSGCLLRNHYWKNFKMTFEMKFINNENKTIGIAFRAEDLDNYFMLLLSDKDNHKHVTPHVRYCGGWDVFSSINMGSDIFNDENYIDIALEVKNNAAHLKVNGHLEFIWVLPTHVDVNYRESGVEINGKYVGNKDINKGVKAAGHVQEIPFRLNYGMVGFRAHPGEGAIIKGLKVEPL